MLGTLDTPSNPRGLAALTVCSDPACLLALPAEGGAVRVYDAARSGGGGGVDVLCELEAHRSPVSVMAWDEEGVLLATASKKGTVVRVHGVSAGGPTHAAARPSLMLAARPQAVVLGLRQEGPNEGCHPAMARRLPLARQPACCPSTLGCAQVRRSSEDKALEFRRGSTAANITCLAFSPSAVQPRLLCAASDHGTIHIFKLHPHGRCTPPGSMRLQHTIAGCAVCQHVVRVGQPATH